MASVSDDASTAEEAADLMSEDAANNEEGKRFRPAPPSFPPPQAFVDSEDAVASVSDLMSEDAANNEEEVSEHLNVRPSYRRLRPVADPRLRAAHQLIPDTSRNVHWRYRRLRPTADPRLRAFHC